ncbi:MAG: signal peptidase II, partial [Gemmatimonadetes bacterium]|nr:signal peptidase II [Gemmatimonadota bacterium]
MPLLLPFLAVLLADQASKLWALATLWDPPRSMEALPGLLHLTPVENRGIAFGALQGHGTVLVLVVLAVLAVFAATSWRDLL